MRNIKMYVSALFEGFCIGVNHISNVLHVPIWLAWIISIVTMPINILVMVITLIMCRKVFNEIADEILSVEDEVE